MLQPILGDVGVKAGIIHDGRKAEYEQKPQAERRETRHDKEPRLLPYEFAHQFRPLRIIARCGYPVVRKVHPNE
jgi:hypothetical protein